MSLPKVIEVSAFGEQFDMYQSPLNFVYNYPLC